MVPWAQIGRAIARWLRERKEARRARELREAARRRVEYDDAVRNLYARIRSDGAVVESGDQGW